MHLNLMQKIAHDLISCNEAQADDFLGSGNFLK